MSDAIDGAPWRKAYAVTLIADVRRAGGGCGSITLAGGSRSSGPGRTRAPLRFELRYRLREFRVEIRRVLRGDREPLPIAVAVGGSKR